MFRVTTRTLLMSVLLSCSVVAETLEVEVIEPKVDSYSESIALSGSVEARHDADIAVQQAGLIEALYVDIGAYVNKGDKLLELDASLARFQLNELEAAASAAEILFAEASRLYEEVLALSKTQVVAETLIAERKAAVAAAQATLNREKASLGLQQERLARHTVFAPFDGVIASRNADIGEWVQPQTSVFNLVSNNALRLRLAVPQEYFKQLQAQQTEVMVSLDGNQELQFKLNVSQVVAVSDAVTRTFNVLIDLPQHDTLIAGMSANADLQLSSYLETLLWLPRSAVKAHPDGGSSVFSVNNGKATRHIVAIERRRNNEVAVTGAPVGLNYVAKGVELLSNDDLVSVRAQP